MIQRIQSIYYLLSLICISIVSFGGTIFQFLARDNYYNLSSYGIEHYTMDEKFMELRTTPYYFATIVIALLLVITIFDYKNLNRQLKIGRFVLFLYFVLAVLTFFAYFIGDNLTNDAIVLSKFKFGFFALILGLPLVLLGNMGVKKDKKLLDSLNRLR